MQESIFSTEITHSLRRDNIWTYKIPDIGNVKKPFDRVIDYYGKFVGIEEKLTKTEKFYLRKVSSNQLNNLLELKYGYFLINYRYEGVNTAYLISAHVIKEQIKNKVIGIDLWTLILDQRYVVSWISKKWNLADVLDHILF